MTDPPGDAFHIEIDTSAGTQTIRAVGELDIAAAQVLSDALERADRSDAPVVILDLAAVTFIDSAGVRCVLQAVASSRSNADKLRIRREYSEPVRRLFDMVGASDRLPYA